MGESKLFLKLKGFLQTHGLVANLVSVLYCGFYPGFVVESPEDYKVSETFSKIVFDSPLMESSDIFYQESGET